MLAPGQVGDGNRRMRERKAFCSIFFRKWTAYEMRISDWSSDVCSSDLGAAALARHHEGLALDRLVHLGGELPGDDARADGGVDLRSEERRVGKECVSPCRSRRSASHYKR